VRVGVLGATGRMGRSVCAAVLDAPDLELVAVVARATGVGRPLRDLVPDAPGGLRVSGGVTDLVAAGAEVVVDFSRPEATAAAAGLLGEGVHLVSGTTGLPAELMGDLAALAGKADHGNAVWAPNFALGAVLAMHFAAVAGRFYAAAEVIELHHQGKADAPSGTALRTARAIAAAREGGRGGPGAAGDESVAGARGGEVDGVRVHSVRLPGLVAHQEVIFGGQGEVLTLRHDSLERSSFMPGVLLAVREVPSRPGLTTGLEPLLGLA
jgi:4-hydroxy-tetrahydrodipicolinate reductase